jgi:hypothetical protein
VNRFLGLAIFLAFAAVLILTKPAPQDIASAASGKMNYVIFNRERMPPDFTAAAAAAVLLQTVEDAFSIDVRSAAPGMRWRTANLVFFMYSDFTVVHEGSLKCVWLLRNGFCVYISD